MRNFRKYDIWIDSMEFVVQTYALTERFPADERFGLMSQMRRSAVSIPSNIAEGASRRTDKEFSRFIEVSLGSSFELETQLIISQKRQYITLHTLQTMLEPLHSLQRRLNAFHTKLTIDG